MINLVVELKSFCQFSTSPFQLTSIQISSFENVVCLFLGKMNCIYSTDNFLVGWNGKCSEHDSM